MDRISKLGRIYIGGFIVMSVITFILVNIAVFNSAKYRMGIREKDVLADMYQDMNSIKYNIYDIQQHLNLLREVHEDAVTYQQYSDAFSEYFTYDEKNNVSILEGTTGEEKTIWGDVICFGNIADFKGFRRKEVLAMEQLFKAGSAISDSEDKKVIYTYYSNEGFIAHFPNQDYNESHYSQLEAQAKEVNEVIDNFNKLDKLSYNKLLNTGLQNIDYNESSNGYDYIYIMPIEYGGRIVGLLQARINNQYITDWRNNNYDKYYMTNHNQVISSSDANKGNYNFVEYAKKNYNALDFYENKFPVKYEMRHYNQYTIYILNDEVYNNRLVYIEKWQRINNLSNIIITNLLLLFVVIGIVYLIIVNDNRHGNKLELFIQKSKYDGMTELLNHNHIVEEAEKVVDSPRIKRMGVMMLDIDNFKSVNDTYGHAVGDDVIKVCADCIREVIHRTTGVAGRYGGEEFLVFFTRMAQQECVDLAEEIRVLFHERCMEQLNLDITISLGLYYDEKTSKMDAMDLINLADKNLYKAKRTGKNKVVKNDILDIKD